MDGEVLGEGDAIVMDPTDTVATTLRACEAGATLPYEKGALTLTEAVPFGHKVALTALEKGEAVYKYGEVIGRATAPVDRGTWVHTHNCESTRGRGDRVGQEEQP